MEFLAEILLVARQEFGFRAAAYRRGAITVKLHSLRADSGGMTPKNVSFSCGAIATPNPTRGDPPAGPDIFRQRQAKFRIELSSCACPLRPGLPNHSL